MRPKEPRPTKTARALDAQLPTIRFMDAASRPATQPEEVPLVAARGRLTLRGTVFSWTLALHVGDF